MKEVKLTGFDGWLTLKTKSIIIQRIIPMRDLRKKQYLNEGTTEIPIKNITAIRFKSVRKPETKGFIEFTILGEKKISSLVKEQSDIFDSIPKINEFEISTFSSRNKSSEAKGYYNETIWFTKAQQDGFKEIKKLIDVLIDKEPNVIEELNEIPNKNMIEIKQGEIFDNDKIVELFKCSPQGGMRRSHKTNTLVIVSNHVKSIYSDKWYGDELHYTAMGSSGDQSLNFGQNKTLHQSNDNGIEVHLFEVFELKQYTYQGIIVYDENAYQEKQTDIDGSERLVWMFPLKLKNNPPIRFNQKVIKKLQLTKQKNYNKLNKNQVKRLAESKKGKSQSFRITESKSFERDESIKLYALMRAEGMCQLCDKPAPFSKKDGSPYLEVHHIDYLANGGSDTIENVAAICPNCHRKMHALENQNDINKLKKSAIERLD